MDVNTIAATTATFSAGVTIAAAVMAASAASTVATIAYAILAITASAVSIASITAWIDKDSTTSDKYFEKMGEHIKYAIAGVYQIVAQTLVQSVIHGIAEGISTALRRKIAGPDVTVKKEAIRV